MKLKNKLLPLVGISAVAATVAPIALTSCSNGENMVDLLKYESKFEPIAADKMTEAEAAKAYFGASNAAQLIENDILCLVSDAALLTQMMEEYLPELLGIDAECKMATAQADMHNLSVSYTDNTNKAKLSGQIHLKLTSKVYTKGHAGEENYYIGLYSLETRHTLKNMPYVLWFSLTTSSPATGIQKADLTGNDDWMFSRAYSGSLVYAKSSEPDEYETESENWYKEYLTSGTTEEQTKKWTELDTKLQYVKWTSWYLSNITKKA